MEKQLKIYTAVSFIEGVNPLPHLRKLGYKAKFISHVSTVVGDANSRGGHDLNIYQLEINEVPVEIMISQNPFCGKLCFNNEGQKMCNCPESMLNVLWNGNPIL